MPMDRECPNCACSNPAPTVSLSDAWRDLSDVEGELHHTRAAYMILAHLMENIIEDGHVIGTTQGGRLLKLTTDNLDMLMHALYGVQDQLNAVKEAYGKGFATFQAVKDAIEAAQQAEAS